MGFKDINDLYKLEFGYKDCLNFPDFVQFGVEIEFGGAELDDVRKLFSRKMENLGWIVKSDVTVRSLMTVVDRNKYLHMNMDASFENPEQVAYLYDSEDIIFGGEINSPILHDSFNNWSDLKKACSYLRQVKNVCINSNCALHFHTDKSIFNSPIHLLRYLKLHMLFEDVIYRFGYGITDCPRASIENYAKPINDIVFNNLKKLNGFDELSILNILGNVRKLGFSVYNIRTLNKNLLNTYEDRYFNGTLYEHIIQNCFDFTTRLKLLCRNDNFDWDHIDYLVDCFNPIDFYFFSDVDIDRAFLLASFVYDDDLSRMRFMKQYLKAFSSDDIDSFNVVEKQYRL